MQIGPYIADFVCRKRKLVIEIDGFRYAGNPDDAIRTRWLNQQGYSVLGFWNQGVLQSRAMVPETIVAALEDRIGDAGGETGYWPAASSPLTGEVPRRRGEPGTDGEDEMTTTVHAASAAFSPERSTHENGAR